MVLFITDKLLRFYVRQRSKLLSFVATNVIMVGICGALNTGAVFGAVRFTVIPSSRIGWEVDKTTGGTICSLSSYDICQFGGLSSDAGGFYPSGTATDPRTDDVYVTDIEYHRVQKFTASGSFISMFGWNVNSTKDRLSTSNPAQRDTCTAASKDVCTTGISGAGRGHMSTPVSIAVDPLTGDVYVLELLPSRDVRVDKYTSSGRFVWSLGKKVDRTANRNLCTSLDVDRRAQCGNGTESGMGDTGHGAFKPSQQSGNLLAVNGAAQSLYVGDEHRVQVFGTDGRWRRDVLLTAISSERGSSVVALAVDTAGFLYLVYRAGRFETDFASDQTNIIRKFNERNEQIAEVRAIAKSPEAFDNIDSMATDGLGDLAIMGVEVGPSRSGRFGMIYNASTLGAGTNFAAPPDNDGISFDSKGDLYVATAVDHEIVRYVRSPISPLTPFGVPLSRFGSGLTP